MTLLMRDKENIERGRQQGIEKGIEQLVFTLHDLDISDEVILQKIQEKFQLSKEKAEKFL